MIRPNGMQRRAICSLCLLLLFSLLIMRFPLWAQKPIDFTLKDMDGNPVKLSDHLGKSVILIDFWATWCVPCVKELTHFQRFHETYKDNGLLILAITVDGPETVAMVRPFIKRYKYTFPVLLDTDSKVIALYNPRVVMPYTVLIGRDGHISNIHLGYSLGDEKVIEKEILELLKPKEAIAKKEISVSANEAFLNREFSDEDYVERVRGGRASKIINQFDLTVNWGDFLVGGRVDADVDFSPYQGEYSLAKSFAEFNHRSFSLRAGDFYHTVGRGLSFSLLKTFEKEGLEYIIDTTVKGGKASLAYKQITAEVFGGWIKREETAYLEEKTIWDKVLGGTLGLRLRNFADLKFNFVGSQIEKGTLTGTKEAAMESVTLEIPNIKEKARFYGEFLLLQKRKWYKDYWLNGHGIYLESSFYLKNLTLLLEFKDYQNLDFEYNRPPLLESEQLPIVASQFANYSKDITAAAGRVDYYFSKAATLLFARFSYFDDKPGYFPRTIAHFFAGYEKKFKETGWLTLIGGYRRENASSLVFYYTAGNTVHYQGNLSYPLNKRLSLELDLEGKEFDGTISFGTRFNKYYERRSYVSLHYSPRFIFTFFFDQTDDPQIMTFKKKENWYGAQVEVKFSHAKSIRVFYGSNKGGVKCAGGVCKFFPPFEGLRVDAVLRF